MPHSVCESSGVIEPDVVLRPVKHMEEVGKSGDISGAKKRRPKKQTQSTVYQGNGTHRGFRYAQKIPGQDLAQLRTPPVCQ